MGINYRNLDANTREHMRQEIEMGNHYVSPRLTQQGKSAWAALLSQAATGHSDDWLAGQLIGSSLILTQEDYTRNGITRSRAINQAHSAQQLAEGEFNRYYVRALCVRAQQAGIKELLVYRGKEVEKPRPESEAKVGTAIAVDALLATLRANDFVSLDSAMGVPSGPNSGLTCRLPD